MEYTHACTLTHTALDICVHAHTCTSSVQTHSIIYIAHSLTHTWSKTPMIHFDKKLKQYIMSKKNPNKPNKMPLFINIIDHMLCINDKLNIHCHWYFITV